MALAPNHGRHLEYTFRIRGFSGYPKVEIGEKVYLRGVPTGIDASTWDTIRHTKGFLKAPITTPQVEASKASM